MRKTRALCALVSLLISLVTLVPSGAAMAAESIPELQWPPVKSSRYVGTTITSPSGVTNGCEYTNGVYSNLKSISTSGQVVRELNPNQPIDGRPNCIGSPVVDKSNDLYGYPYGRDANGTWDHGSNLLAYRGTALKWKYPNTCPITPAVGADGNIYIVTNGDRLVGLSPEVAPGTTQPKKVLDVAKVARGCYGSLHTLRDGIVHLNEGQAYLYTYSGRYVGKTPSGTYLSHYEQIGTTGRAFYQVWSGSGSAQTIKVVAYDLFRQKEAWTAPATMLGQPGVGISDVRATSDGGAVVTLERPKVVGGAPTTERVFALIKLNALGAKVWESELPYKDAANRRFNFPRAVGDTKGNIVVSQERVLATNDPYNSTMPAVAVLVYKGSGDGSGRSVVTYSKIMRGNLDKASGGVNGYSLGGSGWNGPTTGPNTLYFLGVCEGACGEYGLTKLYAAKVPGLDLDYPRGAVIEGWPQGSYVALGDSFSSGLGVEPFEVGTVAPRWNECYRSNYAYARLISGTSPKIPSLGSSGFRACASAVTGNITGMPQWYEGTQLNSWPDTTVKLVTLTIGGNDIRFGDFGSACVFATCGVGSFAYNTSLNAINNYLPGRLEEVYKRILQYAPNAKVYVLGYPHVIANKTATAPLDGRCLYMYDSRVGVVNRWAEIQGARDIVTRLNAKIRQKVNDVRAISPGNQRLVYVPLDGAGSRFSGHEICGTSPSWFLNVDQGVNNKASVFHPNRSGQEGYAAVIKAAINAG